MPTPPNSQHPQTPCSSQLMCVRSARHRRHAGDWLETHWERGHQNAWPFMEPVKKTEAPGYYQVIRFPMEQTQTYGLIQRRVALE
ncbi:hypothetical protein JZ751_014465 [Albula glossodonta]|uniref:Bromo domain-containing protein n=1 Tax=Albula glossodonta TaxID=121402 RepID=A0A8T2MJ28_9TELE|nr:hypothetical protein JZ751_014465 [Albula glossodonta]